jgi:hypothetical protein
LTWPVAALLVLAAVGCRERSRSESADAYRAFKRLAAATALGVNKPSYDGLLQDAATQVLILRDFAKTTSDSTVFRHYASALDQYKDAAALWSEKIDDSQYDWIPKGRIMLVDTTMAARYKLATTSHEFPYSHTKYTTVPSESIQKIWLSAESAADSASALLLPALQDGK